MAVESVESAEPSIVVVSAVLRLATTTNLASVVPAGAFGPPTGS
jgi:hypothetical protein